MYLSGNKPILYLFKSNFVDYQHPQRRFFCPYCAQVEGMMSLFPVIRQEIQVKYIGFEKPRANLSELCGETNQSCPQLLFPNGDDPFSHEYSIAGIGETKRIEKTLSILDYFVRRFDLPERH